MQQSQYRFRLFCDASAGWVRIYEFIYALWSKMLRNKNGT